MRKYLLIIILALSAITANAQKWAVGTNILEYANLGTLNLEASFAPARHVSLDLQTGYNPWTFKDDTPEQYQNRSLSASLGARWWSWHVFAGWWVKGALQYELYNRGGILDKYSEEGHAYGGSVSAGYAWLISDRLNLDFGLGLWGGRRHYTTYRCTSCGRIDESGKKWFVAPDDIMVSLVYIF